MVTQRCAIGIDVGGSSIKAGIVDWEGHVWRRVGVPTPATASGPEIVEAIIDVGLTVRRYAQEEGYRVDGLGFGMPHFSVGPSWIQTNCPNLPGLEGMSLRPPLLEAFGESIACDLDTNAAAAAEWHFGAAVGYTRAIVMVIGTGISCGILVDNGRLVRHTFGTTGETGHVIVAPDSDARCSTGCRGCLESIAAAPAIRRAALEAVARGESVAIAEQLAASGDLDAEKVSVAADAGDPVARDILGRAGSAVGLALVSLTHIYCPDAIIIGGGVSAAGEWLIGPARKVIASAAAPFFTRRLRTVTRAALGSDAGMIGAACLILRPLRD
jgi:glucokinase